MHDEDYPPRRDRYGYEPRRRDDDDYGPPRRDRYDDYDDRRRGRYDYDDDYPGRFRRREGVPWYVSLVASFVLGIAGLALLGNFTICCIGFHAEFIENARPDPIGVVIERFLLRCLCQRTAASAGCCSRPSSNW